MTNLDEVSIQGAPEMEITPENAMEIGKTLGMQYRDITVGRNLHPSSMMIFNAFVAGAMSMGARLRDAGVTPTPAVHMASEGTDCSVMIGNPDDRERASGITFINVDGRYFNESQMYAFRNRLKAEKIPNGYSSIGSMKRYKTTNERYIRKISRAVGSSDCQVIIDCASDSASTVAPFILTNIGNEAMAINSQVDGKAPGRPLTPDETNLKPLSKIVKANYGSIGVAYNGDGTRLGVVDEIGRFVNGRKLLDIIVDYLKPKKVALPIDVSMSTVRKINGYVAFTPLKPNHLGETIKNGDLEFGGNSKGYFVFPENSYTTDAIMASAIVCKIATEGSIRELADQCEEFPRLIKRVRFKEVRELIAKKISSRINDLDYVSINMLDGWRVNYADGWALIKFSDDDSSALDITTEGIDGAYCTTLMEIVRDFVLKCIHLV